MGCTTAKTEIIEDEPSEESLSRIASKFRVVLFGIGKTLYAPPDQPALQVLLQYRNLYELSVKDIQAYLERNEPIPSEVHNRATSTLERMWGIIRTCMQEFNKSMHNKARLLSAERQALMRYTPPKHTVPNPGYSHVPQASQPTDDLIVLDPAEPHV
jgi:hypothetical protein